MKKMLCALFALIACYITYPQGDINWGISHDKEKLFSSSIENEEQNNLSVKISDFKSGKNFTITYWAANSDKKAEWKRTIGLYTSADKELYRKDSDVVKVPDQLIKKMLQENKTIKVYTWSLPKDPKEAARVRIRRVHLCTIMLKQ